jgi:hypothetical protein
VDPSAARLQNSGEGAPGQTIGPIRRGGGLTSKKVSKKPRALQEPVAPTQNVNLKIDQKDSLEQAKLRRVRLLKRMLDEGLITKEEYNEKVDKILSE